MDYEKLQAEHAEWLSHEYPGQQPLYAALGCVEEAGELLHSVLKLEQERVWGFDGRHTQLQIDLLDAVGDCAVFLCSLCNSIGWDFAALMETPCAGPAERSTMQQAVWLVQVAAGLAVPPHMHHLAVQLVAELKLCSWFGGVDFDAAVASVWSTVKFRKRAARGGE